MQGRNVRERAIVCECCAKYTLHYIYVPSYLMRKRRCPHSAHNYIQESVTGKRKAAKENSTACSPKVKDREIEHIPWVEW